MNDRLADLGGEIPSWATESPGSGGAPNNNMYNDHDGDIELGNQNGNSWANQSDDFQIQPSEPQQKSQPPTSQSEQIMETFFQNVNVVTETIDKVSQSTKRIKEMDEKTKLAVSETEEKRMSQEIKSLIQQTNVNAKNAKKILGLLRDENKKYEAEGTVNTSDLRYVVCHGHDALLTTYAYIDGSQLYLLRKIVSSHVSYFSTCSCSLFGS
jgi:hypothetical protein